MAVVDIDVVVMLVDIIFFSCSFHYFAADIDA